MKIHTENSVGTGKTSKQEFHLYRRFFPTSNVLVGKIKGIF